MLDIIVAIILSLDPERPIRGSPCDLADSGQPLLSDEPGLDLDPKSVLFAATSPGSHTTTSTEELNAISLPLEARTFQQHRNSILAFFCILVSIVAFVSQSVPHANFVVNSLEIYLATIKIYWQ